MNFKCTILVDVVDVVEAVDVVLVDVEVLSVIFCKFFIQDIISEKSGPVILILD